MRQLTAPVNDPTVGKNTLYLIVLYCFIRFLSVLVVSGSEDHLLAGGQVVASSNLAVPTSFLVESLG